MINNAARVQADFDQFIMGFQTLILASVSSEGSPEVSYAPFVRVAGVWYVYVSELASHTKNMLDTGLASALLIESEQDASNLFARKRASFQMRADEVSRETVEWCSVMAIFESRFGSVVGLIKDLTDFHLMALTPLSGSFVRGFAQAFTLGGETMLLVNQRREPTGANSMDVNCA